MERVALLSYRRQSRTHDKRGNARDRAARKRYLLAAHGDGLTAPCFRCSTRLDYDAVTADRIIPGARGGTYRRENIRPACSRCQSETGNELRTQLRHERGTT